MHAAHTGQAVSMNESESPSWEGFAGNCLAYQPKQIEDKSMDTILLIIVLLLLFGGGGGLYWGFGAGWGIGPIGLIILVLVVAFLLNGRRRRL